MKKAMSGFDLRAMAQELDALKGAYVKKAYMPHYEQIVLRVNPRKPNSATSCSFVANASTPRSGTDPCQ